MEATVPSNQSHELTNKKTGGPSLEGHTAARNLLDPVSGCLPFVSGCILVFPFALILAGLLFGV